MNRGLKSFLRDHLLLTALVCTMSAVLLILATLQYRWSRQIREANEVRVGENLRAEMMDWHADLLHEFSSIAVSLEVSPDSGAHGNWRDYVERFAEWKQTAPHPAWAQDLFLWETSAQPARLLRVDLEREDLEAIEAAPKQRVLLSRLQSRSANLEEALEAWRQAGISASPESAGSRGPGNAGRHADPMSGWQFDPHLPALVHPIVHHALPQDSPRAANRSQVDWLIVLLNLSTLGDQVLPALSQRHFGGENVGLEYSITVTTGKAPALILYRSDPEAGQRPPEVQMSIFGPPPEVQRRSHLENAEQWPLSRGQRMAQSLGALLVPGN